MKKKKNKLSKIMGIGLGTTALLGGIGVVSYRWIQQHKKQSSNIEIPTLEYCEGTSDSTDTVSNKETI